MSLTSPENAPYDQQRRWKEVYIYWPSQLRPSAANWYPSSHKHWNVPHVLRQVCWHMPGRKHSSTSDVTYTYTLTRFTTTIYNNPIR